MSVSVTPAFFQEILDVINLWRPAPLYMLCERCYCSQSSSPTNHSPAPRAFHFFLQVPHTVLMSPASSKASALPCRTHLEYPSATLKRDRATSPTVEENRRVDPPANEAVTSGSTGGGVPRRGGVGPRCRSPLHKGCACVAAGGWAFARVGGGRRGACGAAVVVSSALDRRGGGACGGEAVTGAMEAAGCGGSESGSSCREATARGLGAGTVAQGTDSRGGAPGGGWAGSLKPWLRPGGPSSAAVNGCGGRRRDLLREATGQQASRTAWDGRRLGCWWIPLSTVAKEDQWTHERVTRRLRRSFSDSSRESELSFAGFGKNLFLEVHHLFQQRRKDPPPSAS